MLVGKNKGHIISWFPGGLAPLASPSPCQRAARRGSGGGAAQSRSAIGTAAALPQAGGSVWAACERRGNGEGTEGLRHEHRARRGVKEGAQDMT